jgi:Ca-activated chloride channel family protein
MKNNVRLLTAIFIPLLGIALMGFLLGGCASAKKPVTPIPNSIQGISSRSSSLLGVDWGADEEIWIITRSAVVAQVQDVDSPRSGALMARLSGQDKQVPVPLKRTSVKASISGFIATVDVSQLFHNPFDAKIEASYVFPLPQNAAVNEFVMTIGKRRIRGIIREREEAKQIYEEAKSQGYAASLMTQERPNIFTQSVANIEPGKEIAVNIKYFNTLAFDDGWYEFVFPMVVGPRYNPAYMTKGIGAVARGESGASGQSTEVEYLKPGERSGHEISLRVDIDGGVPIEEFKCASHVIVSESPEPARLKVELAANDRIPNKDFVLRYRLAGEQIKSSFFGHRDERGGFFTLALFPPMEMKELNRQPMEMIFVMDSSGSMTGRPLDQAKAAVKRALQHMQPGDSFQIINFSESTSQLGSTPMEATPKNIRSGLRYVENIESSGGTEMINGIKAALDFDHDPKRLRFVTFLTDGYIGNEDEILSAIDKRLGDSRIFSFGVGSSVNHYLLDSMAKMGRGAVAYLGEGDSVSEVIDRYFERISHPALTDVKIDWGQLEAYEVFPKQIPDIFVGRPILVMGRFKGNADTLVKIMGRAGNEPFEQIMQVKSASAVADRPALPSVWARMKITSLADQAIRGKGGNVPQAITKVALDYNLMSPFTSFIAVDASRSTGSEAAVTVPVAVPMPEGVNYDTTVK